MSQLDMKWKDISDIFRENLKVENSLMSVRTLFLSDRFAKKIDYKPYFQRNYVWDEEKATYFVESLIIGTEIPPIVLFQAKGKMEVIDGRQRYETLHRFLNNKFPLKDKGLHQLSHLADKRYSELPDDIKADFENTKLRVLKFSVVNEPTLDDEKEDRIKKEIFRRYNSGIVPLLKDDIQRAAYNSDPVTNRFKDELNHNQALYDKTANAFLPKSKARLKERDKVSAMLLIIRRLLTMPYIPIYSYAAETSRDETIRVFYEKNISSANPDEILKDFSSIIEVVNHIKQILRKKASKLVYCDLFFECCYWALAIMRRHDCDLSSVQMDRFCEDITQPTSEVLWNGIKISERSPELVFDKTGSHYYLNVVNRYLFVSNYFSTTAQIDFSTHMKNTELYQKTMANVPKEQYERVKLHKPDPSSMTIEDILSDMKRTRFLVRPEYQRSEVSNEQKASYLLESIMLGMSIPPIYVFRRKDKVKEVVDGQQRLLAILGFLGEPYRNETGKDEFSTKNDFRLKKLRVLSELNGLNHDDILDAYPVYIDKIWDFQINVVEIDAETNPNFNCIDLFLRLNTKPYPIKEDSFEMWNAYIDKKIIVRIRELAKKYASSSLRPQDKRMKNEELLATMACLEYLRTTSNIQFEEQLNMYVRNRRLCARIASKKALTKTLTDVSQGEKKTVDLFFKAVDKVDEYLKTLAFLCDNDSNTLNYIMGQRKKGTNCRTDQNYYFLWLILNRIETEIIIQRKAEIVKKLHQFYINIQDVETEYAAQYLEEEISKMLSSLEDQA